MELTAGEKTGNLDFFLLVRPSYASDQSKGYYNVEFVCKDGLSKGGNCHKNVSVCVLSCLAFTPNLSVSSHAVGDGNLETAL